MGPERSVKFFDIDSSYSSVELDKGDAGSANPTSDQIEDRSDRPVGTDSSAEIFLLGSTGLRDRHPMVDEAENRANRIGAPGRIWLTDCTL